MKPKVAAERIPYRRGQQEEAALQQLGSLRSPSVPALGSDNQWLRFSVRVLAELWELAGKQIQALQLGQPGARSVVLNVLATPPLTELSSRLGEARLRPVESALLERLRREMGHASRSSALRHALFACRQVCKRVGAGDSVWIERDGELHRLPGLLEIAAALEQASSEPTALISEGTQHWDADLRRSVLGDSAIESCRASALLDKLSTGSYQSVCFEVELPGNDTRVRCLLRRDEAPTAELVPQVRRQRPKLVAAASADGREIGASSRNPPGEWRARGSSHALALGEEAQCVRP